VDVFLSSFPQSIDFDPYTKKEDARHFETKYHLAPSWFTEPIKGGKIGYTHDEYDIHIYIDTSNERQYIVYLLGFGDLPKRDVNSPDGNEVSSPNNVTATVSTNITKERL
jgi:hypothetical protein